MIRIDQELTIEGVTVYRDEAQRNKFYVLPNQPRFRLDDSGKPVFKFIKYRTPIDKQGGGKGGGFVIFDSEFVIPEDKLKKVQSALDNLVSSEKNQGPAQIGEFTFTRGTSTLQLLDSGGALVEKVMSAGKPSLYGHNVCSFTCELSPEGAAIVEAAMQGSGGVAQVIYDLYFIAKIPPIRGHVYFRAEKFYSYWQKIDKSDDHWWNGNSGELRDKRREEFMASDSGGVDFNFDWNLPDPDQDAKLKNKIRDWGWGALDDAVKRLTLTDPTANTDTGLPDGVHHVTRDFSTDKTASFDRYYSESDAVEWHIVPQGTLPNITSIGGVKWNDYAVTVDADDPFFKTLNVNVGVNADFKKFGIDSVDVHVEYNEGGTHAVSNPDFHITTPDQRSAFSSYIENNNWKFKYKYRVNYVGDSRVFDSGPIETDQTGLTIDVGDMGLLSVEVIAGGINWDQVASAEVTLSYQDDSSGVQTVEQRYVLTKTDNSFHWLKVILARRTKPYQYSVKYTMTDGKEYTTANLQADAPELYVDAPFYTKALHVRPLGDFNKDIDTIFIDMTYTDAAHNYTQQKSMALTKATPFYDWTFPALTGSTGQIGYSGKIKFQDGTEEDIPQQTATSDSIYLGSVAAVLAVTIEPSLIDWTTVKLVTVHVAYTDAANGIDEEKTVPIKSGVTPGIWSVKLKDKTKKSFSWSATYYLNDSSHRSSAPVTTEDTTVVLQLPSA
jgi:hypothetical protein